MSLRILKSEHQLRWELICYKAFSSLKSEASRSRLGFVWWVLDPILYMAVFYLVFGLVFERGGDDFIGKLLVALVIWRWFDNTVKSCSVSLASGAGLMRQVYVSKLLFPLSSILAQGVKFLVVLMILLTFLLFYGIKPGVNWLGLLPLLLAELFFISGLGILLAAITPLIPDIKVVVDYGLQLGFFMSGVFYELSQIPESMQFWFQFNPMAIFIDQARQILLYGQAVDWSVLGWIVLASVACLTVGSFLLAKFDRDYPTLILI